MALNGTTFLVWDLLILNLDNPEKLICCWALTLTLDVLLQGRRNGPFGTPSAFETNFGWVLAGRTNSHTTSPPSVAAHHVAVESGDDVLRKFWEVAKEQCCDPRRENGRPTL